MKKFFKILLIFFLITGVSLYALPIFYKDEIADYIKKDINNMLDAKFDFSDVSASLFKDFPNLQLSLNEVKLDGKGTFKDVRLLDAKHIGMSLDLKSVIKGEQVIIKKFTVDQANVDLRVLKNGLTNYDIMKTDSTETSSEEISKFNIKLKEYEILDSNLSFKDEQNKFSTELANINHKGNAVLTDLVYHLNTTTTADNVTLIYDNVKYLNDVKLSLVTPFDISGDFEKYVYKDAKILVNDLPISSKGSVTMEKDAIDLDIEYQSENAGLNHLLSLVPREYMPDLEGVKTTGIVSVGGNVKGKVTDTDLPAFKVNVNVKNATLQYPDLPEKVTDINAITNVIFKGGSNMNNTSIDLPIINFKVLDNTAKGNLKITHPIDNPIIDTKFVSKFDLSKLKEAVKLPGLNDLQGLLDADFSLNGSMASIEKQDFENFDASGHINLDDFIFKSDSLDYPVTISKSAFNITPKLLEINKFQAKIGASDFDIKGNVSNYIAYVFGDDKVLKATISSHSNYLNLNEFMVDEDENTTSDEPFHVIKIPKNIDIKIHALADKAIYKDLNIFDAKGELIVKDEAATLSTVFMKMFGGQIKMDGSYDSKEEQPKTRFALNMDNLGISESASSFSMFSAYAPMLKQIAGKYFSSMNFEVNLDEQMNPVLSTMNAKGTFNTDKIAPKTIDVLKKIGSITKLSEFSNPTIDKIKASFIIAKGKMEITPFEFKLNDMDAALQGTFDLDQKLNFVLTLDVPREKFGNNINSVVENIAGGLSFLKLDKALTDIVKMKFKIGGTALKPTVKPFISGKEDASVESLITDAVEEKIDDIKNDAIEKAQIEADKLIAEAEVQKQKLIEEAEKLAKELKVKAKESADKLIKDAGNDPFKKMGAKIAADKINKEADKKAIKLVDKARVNGDKLVLSAKENANLLLEKAKNTHNKDTID